MIERCGSKPTRSSDQTGTGATVGNHAVPGRRWGGAPAAGAVRPHLCDARDESRRRKAGSLETRARFSRAVAHASDLDSDVAYYDAGAYVYINLPAALRPVPEADRIGGNIVEINAALHPGHPYLVQPVVGFSVMSPRSDIPLLWAAP
eukprot:27322-Rhodomonas_salina.2